jgi:hypothetical protein
VVRRITYLIYIKEASYIELICVVARRRGAGGGDGGASRCPGRGESLPGRPAGRASTKVMAVATLTLGCVPPNTTRTAPRTRPGAWSSSGPRSYDRRQREYLARAERTSPPAKHPASHPRVESALNRRSAHPPAPTWRQTQPPGQGALTGTVTSERAPSRVQNHHQQPR